MHDPAIFCLSNFCYPEQIPIRSALRREPSRIVHLPAAGGVEGRAIEIHTVACIDIGGRHDLGNLAFKLVQEGIVIVEPVGHTYPFYMDGVHLVGAVASLQGFVRADR